MISENENMSIFLNSEEFDDEDAIMSNLDLRKILEDLDNIELNNDNNESSLNSLSNYYEINYNVKQLLLICDYYKIGKNLRICKSNKTEIIESIVFFESNSENFEIVLKRKQLWFYIKELNNDNFMKKYILCGNIF